MHAKMLPAEAGALARLLEQDEILQAALRYKKADKAALVAQQRYKRLNLTIIGLRVLAIAFGFLLAVPKGVESPFPAGWDATIYHWAFVLQLLTLATILGLGVVIDKRKFFRRWRVFRAQAEHVRRGYFGMIMSAKERVSKGETALLPLKLDYFRRHHLVAQREYFSRRGREHKRKAWRTQRAIAWMKWLSILSLLPISWVALETTQTVGLNTGEINRYFLALGTIAAVFLGALDSISKANLDARNAVRYSVVAENLKFLEERELPEAQSAADKGKAAVVQKFVERVNREIALEHREWRFLRDEFQRQSASEASVPET